MIQDDMLLHLTHTCLMKTIKVFAELIIYLFDIFLYIYMNKTKKRGVIFFEYCL